MATVTVNSAVLPVELLVFKGKNTEGGNLLTWATATETKTSHFDIERSIDGKTFEKIGKAKAQGSNSNYQFLDKSPLWGLGGLYYRLAINDLDGRFAFSNIINIVSTSKSKVKIYPSVSEGILTVEGAKSFDIVNALGQIVLSKTDAFPQSTVNIEHLKNGFYLVRGLNTEGVGFVEKIVKH